MKMGKLSKILIVGITAISVLSGCGKTGSSVKTEASASKSETFTYGIDGDPGNSVNVITTSDRYGLMEIKALYSPLYMYNSDKVEYFLAESMTPSEDKLTYTAKLRKDVKWSDGVKFTADDVVFTYNEMLNEKNAGWAYSQLIFNGKPVKVEKVDDYTVNFILPEVSAPAMELLGDIFIMPKHVYEGETNFENSEKNAKPVGTGPYKLEEYKAGQYVKLVKNDDYFLGAPQIQNVVFKTIPDANTAKLSLQKGEINALIVQSSDLKDLKSDKLTSYTYDEGRIAYMVMNSKSVKLQNEDVRKAIFYALNRKDMINAAFGSDEYAKEAYTFLPNESKYHTDDVEKYDYNQDKAKELLAKAGVSGLKLKLGYVGNNVPYQKEAAIIQQNLKAVGIDVELSGGEDAAITKKMKDPNSDYDMFLGGYIMGIDPDTFNSLFIPGSHNYSHFDDNKLVDLFNAGRVEKDEAKRKEIYNDAQKQIQNDAYFYPILENKRILVMSSNVDGVKDAALVPVYTFEDMSKLHFK
ncbi:ABC transporter substrate-binding protein [Clostridium beijerinckii]|uniref:Peptide/nickel transport system substrate-binding protein n=3 Tax=Clostridium beijerinckii TaxID=1520 RepID=A0A9Q5GKN0_CLOBE|nr:ABC transporter substrate-binding protein [Clostridium beijerinckii]AQS05379.1 oligopeptide-binding protein AppA precursor [Clostridium beijerinckii]MBA2885557.1 peptide/nickel transport system substrate-binding protein [Clostridium beijerinckii]MBA2900291.1 peptide/nickel transport system substrate-binding protein [Clostridium beijerinckii]MBA2910116.1 peptide/nickel transport system substrate-binding protein [Clostridium beijerinckii]MBA9015046.1 peptide/nickel transport system substrate-